MLLGEFLCWLGWLLVFNILGITSDYWGAIALLYFTLPKYDQVQYVLPHALQVNRKQLEINNSMTVICN